MKYRKIVKQIQNEIGDFKDKKGMYYLLKLTDEQSLKYFRIRMIRLNQKLEEYNLLMRDLTIEKITVMIEVDKEVKK